MEQIKLNLGCGDKILKGYINVDIVSARSGNQPDIICDIKNLNIFKDNYCDEILCIHIVEHFWRWEIIDVMREWIRVLKTGRKLIIECPNLLSACKELVNDPINASSHGKYGQKTMWVLYGDPSWKDPFMMHKWGYTPQSLAQLMHECGLKNIQQEKAQFKLKEPRDMRITGIKQ
jgi:ubiquinone/menaquinone biosynthesis C-methylase UbiE